MGRRGEWRRERGRRTALRGARWSKGGESAASRMKSRQEKEGTCEDRASATSSNTTRGKMTRKTTTKRRNAHLVSGRKERDRESTTEEGDHVEAELGAVGLICAASGREGREVGGVGGGGERVSTDVVVRSAVRVLLRRRRGVVVPNSNEDEEKEKSTLEGPRRGKERRSKRRRNLRSASLLSSLSSFVLTHRCAASFRSYRSSPSLLPLRTAPKSESSSSSPPCASVPPPPSAALADAFPRALRPTRSKSRFSTEAGGVPPQPPSHPPCALCTPSGVL